MRENDKISLYAGTNRQESSPRDPSTLAQCTSLSRGKILSSDGPSRPRFNQQEIAPCEILRDYTRKNFAWKTNQFDYLSIKETSINTFQNGLSASQKEMARFLPPRQGTSTVMILLLIKNIHKPFIKYVQILVLGR